MIVALSSNNDLTAVKTGDVLILVNGYDSEGWGCTTSHAGNVPGDYRSSLLVLKVTRTHLHAKVDGTVVRFSRTTGRGGFAYWTAITKARAEGQRDAYRAGHRIPITASGLCAGEGEL